MFVNEFRKSYSKEPTKILRKQLIKLIFYDLADYPVNHDTIMDLEVELERRFPH